MTEGTRDLQVTFAWAPRFGSLLGQVLSSQWYLPLHDPLPPSSLYISHTTTSHRQASGATACRGTNSALSHPCFETQPPFWKKQENLGVFSPTLNKDIGDPQPGAGDAGTLSPWELRADFTSKASGLGYACPGPQCWGKLLED